MANLDTHEERADVVARILEVAFASKRKKKKEEKDRRKKKALHQQGKKPQ